MKLKHYVCRSCGRKYADAPDALCNKCANREVVTRPMEFPRIAEDAAAEMLATLNRSLARTYRQMADTHEQLAVIFDEQAKEERAKKPLASLPAPVSN